MRRLIKRKQHFWPRIYYIYASSDVFILSFTYARAPYLVFPFSPPSRNTAAQLRFINNFVPAARKKKKKKKKNRWKTRITHARVPPFSILFSFCSPLFSRLRFAFGPLKFYKNFSSYNWQDWNPKKFMARNILISANFHNSWYGGTYFMQKLLFT